MKYIFYQTAASTEFNTNSVHYKNNLSSNNSKNRTHNEIVKNNQRLDVKIPKQTDFINIVIDLSKLRILELVRCNLTTLPHTIQNLNITHLNISNNKFSDVPSCIAVGMKSLQYLDIGHNTIKYFPALECVPKLKSLKLNDNSFISIPSFFLTFACCDLEEFDYSHNRANSYEYWKYSYLDKVNVKSLKLRNACLIDKDLRMLKNFKKLEVLDIGNEVIHEPRLTKSINKFKDLDMLFVGALWKNLYVLNLRNLGLVLFPPGIMWLELLSELDISHNYITWISDGIEYLVNLQTLNISHNNLVSLPKNIDSLEYLEVIRAQHNHIDFIPALPKSLKYLDLYDNLIETVTCDTSQINCDFECNYVEMNDLEYVKGRDLLRRTFEVDNYRINKCLSRAESIESFDSSGTELSDFDESIGSKFSDKATDTSFDTCVFDNSVSTSQNMSRVYVKDEDWMFEDAD